MKILVYPKNQFPTAVKENPNSSYISINDEGDLNHYLESKENVLNLNFSDSDNGMTDELAETVLNFIERNLGKDFIIHCTAGISRSQAIGKFIKDFYEDYYNAETNKNNPCITPNMNVYIMLKEAYYDKHGFPFESNKELFLRNIKRDAGKFVIFNEDNKVNLLIGLIEDYEDYYWVSIDSNNKLIYTTGCCGYKISNRSFKRNISDKDLRIILDSDLDHWELLLHQDQNPEVKILYSII